MQAVRINKNTDGTYTAYIFSTSFTGSYADCVNWLKCNGETI